MADYASSLPVRTETAGDIVSKLCDGTTNTQLLAIDASGKLKINTVDTVTTVSTVTAVTTVATVTNVTTLGTITNDVGVINGATALEVAQTSGDVWEVHMNNSTAGDQINTYGTSAAVAINTPTNVVNYTVTALKTMLLKKVFASASGKIKGELKAGTPASETTRAVGFNSASNPNVDITFSDQIEVAAGDKILMVITNIDKSAMDLYAFINGIEV